MRTGKPHNHTSKQPYSESDNKVQGTKCWGGMGGGVRKYFFLLIIVVELNLHFLRRKIQDTGMGTSLRNHASHDTSRYQPLTHESSSLPTHP